MNAYLRQNILGNAKKIQLSNEQYEEISQSHTALVAAFALEETYDLLIGNYIELEQDVLTAAAAHSVYELNECQDFFELRSSINRRVINLLTATRLYLDQTPQRLANCASNPAEARQDFKLRTSHHYDEFFGYRFLEALRNHVQHCGLAVHRLAFNRKKIGEEHSREIEFSIQLFTERKHLQADGGFKKKLLKELDEKIYLTPAIREYIQCISDLHVLVRRHTADRVNKSRATISEHISKYSELNQGSVIGLTAFRLISQDKKESVPLFLNWDDVRLKLVEKNSHLGSLSRHVVSGRGK